MILNLVKDEQQKRRYRQLSEAEREKVDSIVRRHIAACAKQDVPAEIEPTFREAIDLVLTDKWQPESKWDRPQVLWKYQVYVAPDVKKEAA